VLHFASELRPPTARRTIAFPELLLPKVRLGKPKVIVKTLRLKTTLDVCAINELDALESVFSLLHPVNAGSYMFRNFLRAPSPQATQAIDSLPEESAVNVSFSGLPFTGPLSAPSAFANNDPRSS
jgi:hypothetical protein